MKRILIGVAVFAAAAFQLQPAQARPAGDQGSQAVETASGTDAGECARDDSRRKRSGKAGVAEKQYPSATRDEPDAKASTRMTPKLQKLYKAYDDDNVAAAQPVADEIIGDDKANAYDKAMSARIMGAMLLATDTTAAGEYLQRAIEFDGLSNNDHYETMFIISQLQMQDEKYAEALATLERLQQETNSQKPDHLAMKGNALFQLERYPEAIVALKAAIDGSAEPRADWTQLLMAAYAESGQGGEAARLAEQAAAQAPGDKRSQLNLAAAYLQNEQYDKAAGVYEKLRAAGELTEDRDYRNLMAIYLNSDNREKDAIAVIKEGLEKGVLNGDYNTYVALAQAYYFSEQSEPAIEAYRKAAPLAPNGETYLNLARVLLNEGRTAEAKQAAQQALDKGLKSPDDAKRILAR